MYGSASISRVEQERKQVRGPLDTAGTGGRGERAATGLFGGNAWRDGQGTPHIRETVTFLPGTVRVK